MVDILMLLFGVGALIFGAFMAWYTADRCPACQSLTHMVVQERWDWDGGTGVYKTLQCKRCKQHFHTHQPFDDFH